CLYAWFNIFSNWAPYDTDATGRIRVAVANSDAGAEVLGLRVNVGDKIIEALQSNDSIGWVFPNAADEALEGVWASDYYAALIIPQDFTQNDLSFLGGSLENPKLLYYENEKKNAIAPKITGKAKTAVQEQVNAAFVETIATYVSDAASVLTASGYDPQTVLRSVSAQTAQLNDRLEDVSHVLRAASGLTGAAESLIGLSGTLVGDANAVTQAGQSVLNAAGETVSDADTASGQTAAALRSLIAQFDGDLEDLADTLTIAFGDLNRYNDFVTNDLSARAALAAAYRDNAQTAANDLETLGLTVLSKGFSDLAARYARIYDRLSRLETVSEDGWDGVRSEQQAILSEITEAQTVVTTLGSVGTDALESKLQTALTAAQNAVNEASASLSGMGGSFQQLGTVLASYSAALDALQGGLVGTAQAVSGLQDRLNTVSALLERLSESELLGRLTGILSDDAETIASYLASPVQMNTEVIYEVREYGSAMAPFYTVLAQWVGALLAAVLLKVRIKRPEQYPDLRLWQSFFGRYGLFLFVGLAQGLIVSLGDLIYVGIQCLHPVRFVLAACLNGVCFTMINYALVFALENIGQALGVIVLVVQVAGAGGTYPVEVLPRVFQKLYPAMPFRYAMDAMRECVAGMYGCSYAKCMGALALFTLGAVAFGLALYWPAKWLNRLINESKARSEIML
ncbi:MAG: YhgE/Pip domain-containing protein, partial [Oscillospiraceae bacterium]|nr:YhgE/Pip domain-containing protein [Oscillospiraceae bacterium]